MSHLHGRTESLSAMHLLSKAALAPGRSRDSAVRIDCSAVFPPYIAHASLRPTNKSTPRFPVSINTIIKATKKRSTEEIQGIPPMAGGRLHLR